MTIFTSLLTINENVKLSLIKLIKNYENINIKNFMSFSR